MRFGISLISWMLPKILRIRRWLVFVPVEVLRGASIALVAMIVPALLGTGDVSPGPDGVRLTPEHDVGARFPLPPPQCVRPVRRSGPVPGRAGKAPGARHRAAEPLFVGLRRYSSFQALCKRLLGLGKFLVLPCLAGGA